MQNFLTALEEIDAVRADLGVHMSSVKSRIMGATEERAVVAQEAEAKEQRLNKAEATLNDRLDHLLCKRRQLEEELEMVRGEMLSCDTQLKEVSGDV